MLLAAALGTSTGLAAEAMPEMPKSLGGVGESVEGRFNGSYQTSIPIEVPAFHGIEPKLALHYDSSQGNGWLGLGWSLSGLSQIERMSPGRGAPRVNGDDLYVLDGMELIPCAAGSASPSCKTGGTHSTRIENWQRIKFDSATSQWDITSQNGTRAIYKAGFWVGGTQVKWMLSQVVDMHGNAVSYHYEGDGGDWIYPSSVTYNGTTIAFKREATVRNDPLRIGFGRGLGTVQYRLKTVTVAVGGAYARGYKIGYGVEYTGAAATLGNVTYYGKDLALDATGSIISGTRLPTRWFTYNPSGRGASARFVSSRPATVGNYGSRGAGWSVRTLADVNGDGRQDAVWMFASKASNSGTRVAVARSNGDGTFSPMSYYMPVDSGDYGAGGWDTQTMADVNGDGRQDAVWLYSSYPGSNNGVRVMVSLAQADGSFAEKAQIYNTPDAAGDYGARAWGWQAPKMADVNGDGCADAVWLYAASVSSNLGTRVAVSKSQCNGYFGAMAIYAPSSSGIYHPDNGWTSNGLADVNGDGRMDAYWLYSGRGDGARVAVALAEQNGSFGASGFSYIAPATSGSYGDTSVGWRAPQMADVNGDGKADAVWVYGSVSANNGIKVATSLSNGDGSFQPMAETTPWTSGNYGADWYTLNLADMNGDGQNDVALLYTDRNKGGTAAVICIAQENGTFPYRTGVSSRAWNTTSDAGASTGSGYSYNNAAAGWDTRLVGDIDGDGDADSVWMYSATTADNGVETAVSLSAGGPALMTKDSTGTGATITMSYLPSSQWFNLNGAPVVHALNSVSVNPGAGQDIATTVYGYWGSKYDRVERRFLGFRYVNVVSPATAGSDRLLTEMYFKQDRGAQVLPEQTYRYSYGAEAKIISAEFSEYNQNAAAPYVSLLSGAWKYTYALGNWQSYRRSYKQYVYFADYGNLNLIYDHGDYGHSGDEKTTEFGYAPANADAYLVGLPAYQRVVAGIGTSGATLTQSQQCYDQQGIGQACTWWKNAPSKGNVTQSADWDSDYGQWMAKQYDYDTYGNVTMSEDEFADKTYHAYDDIYHVYLVKNSADEIVDQNGVPVLLENKTEWDYQCGAPKKQFGPNGATELTETTYDNLCRKTQVKTPLGGFTKFWYCQVTSATNQCGSTSGANAQKLFVDIPGTKAGDSAQWSSYYYDGLSRVLSTFTEGPDTTRASIGRRYTYNLRGWLESETRPFYSSETPQSTVYRYDSIGRLTETLYANGKRRLNRYALSSDWVDKSGSRNYGGMIAKIETDELGREREYAYDHENSQIVEAYAFKDETRRIQYRYDLLGRRTGMVDANGNRWSYEYNTRSQVIASNDPDRGRWTFAYYPDGMLWKKTDAKDQVTHYTYDAAGRKTSETLLYGTLSAKTTTWRYDLQAAGHYNRGRLTGMVDSSGSTRYSYDLAGREVYRNKFIYGNAAGFDFYKGYDAAGRLLWSTYPDGTKVGTLESPRTYDNAGHPYSLPGIVSSAQYSADGQPTEIVNANGTRNVYEYDATNGRVKRISVKNASGGFLDDLQYTERDAAGRILRIDNPVDPQSSWTYGYDTLGQLTSASNLSDSTQNQTFDYDAAGNLTYNSRLGAYGYPAQGTYAVRPHAPTSIGGMSYGYDANGSMNSRNGTVVSWNGRNLVSAVGGSLYVYDGDGKRVKTTGAAGNTYFAPSSDHEKVGPGTTYTYVDFAGITIARLMRNVTQKCYYDSEGEYICDPIVADYKHWLHNNHLGSTVLVTFADGSFANRYRHRPYGELISAHQAYADPRDFIGEDRDTDTGLVYQRARYYDPTTARYLSADGNDPANPAVGAARYAYAINDPINFVDDGGKANKVGKPTIERETSVWGGIYGIRDQYSQVNSPQFRAALIGAEQVIERYERMGLFDNLMCEPHETQAFMNFWSDVRAPFERQGLGAEFDNGTAFAMGVLDPLVEMGEAQVDEYLFWHPFVSQAMERGADLPEPDIVFNLDGADSNDDWDMGWLDGGWDGGDWGSDFDWDGASFEFGGSWGAGGGHAWGGWGGHDDSMSKFGDSDGDGVPDWLRTYPKMK